MRACASAPQPDAAAARIRPAPAAETEGGRDQSAVDALDRADSSHAAGKHLDPRRARGCGARAAPRSIRNQLESALLNLAVNARDAMPNGGTLTIETASAASRSARRQTYRSISSPATTCVICVSDTGIGMTQEVLERAFEPFFTTKPLGQGTGLGLSQVFGFVKQSGGNVKMYSRSRARHDGQDLSAAHERAGAVPEDVRRDGDAGGQARPKRILVVEDNEAVRSLLGGCAARLRLQCARSRRCLGSVEDPRRQDADRPAVHGYRLARTQRPRAGVDSAAQVSEHPRLCSPAAMHRCRRPPALGGCRISRCCPSRSPARSSTIGSRRCLPPASTFGEGFLPVIFLVLLQKSDYCPIKQLANDSNRRGQAYESQRVAYNC